MCVLLVVDIWIAAQCIWPLRGCETSHDQPWWHLLLCMRAVGRLSAAGAGSSWEPSVLQPCKPRLAYKAGACCVWPMPAPSPLSLAKLGSHSLVCLICACWGKPRCSTPLQPAGAPNLTPPVAPTVPHGACLAEACSRAICPPATPVCCAALGHPESAPGAASALRQVCEACSGMLGPVAEELLGTYARTQGMGPIEKGVVKNGDLQLQERLVLQVTPCSLPWIQSPEGACLLAPGFVGVQG